MESNDNNDEERERHETPKRRTDGGVTEEKDADLPQLKSEIRKFDFPPRKFDSTWFVFDLFHVKSNLHGVRHIQYFLFCVNHVELNIRGGKSNLQISRQLEC